MVGSRLLQSLAAFGFMLVVALSCPLPSPAQNQNQNPVANSVTGQVDFKGVMKSDRESGVWVDNQYVGYVKELKGPKKVILLPGEHDISVRQAGYLNQDQKVVVEPGKTTLVTVRLEKDPNATYSKVTSQVKIDVTPDRAAVFVDDAFAGSVSDFKGVGRAMLIAPGKHKIKIALAGYRPFETEVNLLPNQKMTVKTDLVEGSILQSDPAIKHN
ncbi:MAG TPA: PEGA domain-containing protein [Candidatus Acidoferrales bacterium]